MEADDIDVDHVSLLDVKRLPNTVNVGESSERVYVILSIKAQLMPGFLRQKGPPATCRYKPSSIHHLKPPPWTNCDVLMEYIAMALLEAYFLQRFSSHLIGTRLITISFRKP